MRSKEKKKRESDYTETGFLESRGKELEERKVAWGL